MEQNKEPFAAENKSYVEAVTNMLLDYYKNDVTYDSVFAAVSDAQDAVEEFTSYAATHTIPECVYYLSDHYDSQLPLSSIVPDISVTNPSCSVTYNYWPTTPPTPCDPVYPGPATPSIPYNPIPTFPYTCQCGGCLAYGTVACPRTNSTPNIVYTGCGPQTEENKKEKCKSKKNNTNGTNTKNTDCRATETNVNRAAAATNVNRGKVDQFKRVAGALAAQYARKNEAYGDSFGKSVKRYGIISALTRMSDKWNRLESLLIDKNNNRVSDESVDDTLLDLATYCIMTVLATRNNDEIDKIVKTLEGK